jgi:hypothetical protein
LFGMLAVSNRKGSGGWRTPLALLLAFTAAGRRTDPAWQQHERA